MPSIRHARRLVRGAGEPREPCRIALTRKPWRLRRAALGSSPYDRMLAPTRLIGERTHLTFQCHLTRSTGATDRGFESHRRAPRAGDADALPSLPPPVHDRAHAQ